MFTQLRTWASNPTNQRRPINDDQSTTTNQRRATEMNKRSYVMVTKGQDAGRIAQVVDYLHDRSVYAVMVNYNGYVQFVKSDFLRKPTKQEKNKDKKQHNLELQLDRYQRAYFNGLIYTD